MSKNCGMSGKQSRQDQLWHYAMSDLDIHCLLMPLCPNTQEPLHNTVHYSIVLVITWFKDGSQSCYTQTKMYRLCRKQFQYNLNIFVWINGHLSLFLYNLNIFVWMQHGCLGNMVFALDPSSSVIKRLWWTSNTLQNKGLTNIVADDSLNCF